MVATPILDDDFIFIKKAKVFTHYSDRIFAVRYVSSMLRIIYLVSYHDAMS
ncbi:hypothetical protein PAUR_b0738 [Pseudoalteromonas aurantia 208]|uniref:Uncharacterized protein n=1 Tax=Pseudoalteromonas aurantia 208 TaxID=1314867 RepID=A0ABR9EI34_9GAMM|nr:hypothetical protein [Pseudoalteromonas aurantia 208]